jgi:hypothetical protein
MKAVARRRKNLLRKTPPNWKGLTFEKVWGMFQESDRKFAELREEIKETSQQMKETDRKMQETDQQIKETGRQMKETDRRMGNLDNRFGELAEHLVLPGIKEKFRELNYTFEQVSKNIEITDSSRKFITEVDILLENGDTVMAVEVKVKPAQKDIKEHIKRLEILRQRADVRHDTRKFQGAIAGAIMSNVMRDYIYKAGLYAIEQTGDTMRINLPPNFKPREW